MGQHVNMPDMAEPLIVVTRDIMRASHSTAQNGSFV